MAVPLLLQKCFLLLPQSSELRISKGFTKTLAVISSLSKAYVKMHSLCHITLCNVHKLRYDCRFDRGIGL